MAAVGLDFAAKTVTRLTRHELASYEGPGTFLWVDIDVEAPSARNGLQELAIWPLVREVSPTQDWEGQNQLVRGGDFLHLRLVSTNRRRREKCEVVIGPTAVVTAHQGPSRVIDAVRETFETDFEAYAESGSFLLFSILESLTRDFMGAAHALDDELVALQAKLGDRRVSAPPEY